MLRVLSTSPLCEGCSMRRWVARRPKGERAPVDRPWCLLYCRGCAQLGELTSTRTLT